MQDSETLETGAVRYRLKYPHITNAELADHLGLENFDEAFRGRPSMFLYANGVLAAIRINADEVAIVMIYERCQAKMSDIGIRIPSDEAGASTPNSTVPFYPGDACTEDDPHVT